MSHQTGHPVPPPELVEEWARWSNCDVWQNIATQWQNIATQAAAWGADQELEACCEWLGDDDDRATLRTARRPKPPSLKELALKQLNSLHADLNRHGMGTNTDTIRRALEALPDDN